MAGGDICLSYRIISCSVSHSGFSGTASYNSRILEICAVTLPAHKSFSLLCPAPKKYSQSERRRLNSRYWVARSCSAAGVVCSGVVAVTVPLFSFAGDAAGIAAGIVSPEISAVLGGTEKKPPTDGFIPSAGGTMCSLFDCLT